MDIADVVRQSGLPPSTLHHYEAKGLIASTGRRGLRRQYGEGVLDRLKLITFGKTAGFSLDEIQTALIPDGGVEVDRAALAAKADELDQTIDELIAIRDGLRHAARCPEDRHLECDNFRALLKRAGTKRRGRR
ncbi:MAG: helix-turn-helix domain-containing protein [Nannocystales bacterium]